MHAVYQNCVKVIMYVFVHAILTVEKMNVVLKGLIHTYIHKYINACINEKVRAVQLRCDAHFHTLV